MARVFHCLVFLALITSPGLSQAQKTAPPAQKQPQANPPDEANPPEEDESVAPRKYVLDPLEAERNIKVGNFYWKKGEFVGALSRYKDATHYNPSSAEAFFRVGETEVKLHHSDNAKIAFEKVIKLAPDSKFAVEARKKLSSLKG